ncbi:uncharacterized protein KIAA1958-like [Oculina patagonica]
MAENVFFEEVDDEILAEAAENVKDNSPNLERKENEEKKVGNRSVQLSEDDLDKIVDRSEAQATKNATKWGVKIFEDWCNNRGVDKKLPELSDVELDQILRRFYAEARAKDGELYGRSSLLAIRNAIERFLNNPPHNRGMKITKGEAFQLSNKMLNSKIKVQKKDGKENVKHKPTIPPGDLRKLSASSVIHGGTPLGLLRNVWFNTSLYWCRRGREGQRELRHDSFVFEVDEDGRLYARMNVDEATKNHPGGIVDVQSSQKFGRMY